MAVETVPNPSGQPERKNEKQIAFVQSERSVYLDGTAIHCVDKTAATPVTPIRTILAPGWSEGKDSMSIRTLMDIMAEEGRSTRSFSHPRHGIHVEKNGLPTAELRKAKTLSAVIEDALPTDPQTGEKTGKVDIVAQSEGGIYSVIAALSNPDRVRNLLLVNPGGISSPRHELLLTNSFLRDAGAEALKGVIDLLTSSNQRKKDQAHAMLDGGKKTAAYFLSNPVRSIEEIRAIAQITTLDLLEKVKKHDIGIYGVSGEDDHIFSAEEMQRNIMIAGGNQEDPELLRMMGLAERTKKRDATGKIVYDYKIDPRITRSPKTLFDGFYTVRGGHFVWYSDRTHHDPQEEDQRNKFLRAIPSILAAAEKKYNKDHGISTI